MPIKEYRTEPFTYNWINVVIFNFDGVLYSSPSYEEEYADYLTQIVSKMSIDGLNLEEARFALEYHKVIGGNNTERRDFREVCEQCLGVLLSDFDNYTMKHPFSLSKNATIETLSNEFLKDLTQKHKLFIVTNEKPELLARKMKRLGIDMDLFTNILVPIYEIDNSFDKLERYQAIISNCSIDGIEAYVVGTNYYSDIAPLMKEYGSGLVADPTNCHATEEFLRKYLVEGTKW